MKRVCMSEREFFCITLTTSTTAPLSLQLKTLRGSILEESVPSAARHTTPRGLSPKRLLEFIIPDLNLHCLRLASTSPKVRDTLLKLDEQGVSAVPPTADTISEF